MRTLEYYSQIIDTILQNTAMRIMYQVYANSYGSDDFEVETPFISLEKLLGIRVR
jgi:hypothetical protein